MIRVRDLLFLGGGLSLGLVAAARVSASPIVVSAPPGTSPSPAPFVAPAPGNDPGRVAPGVLQAVRVNDNTLVTVRDEGDSQVLFVYSFDDNGHMQPVPQKARFFHKF